MKTALITTTINIPKVLELYRSYSGGVRFFVAAEYNASNELLAYLSKLPNTETCMGAEYKCSNLIGWKTISRRNIAMLEALKWGADIIITIDDDNIPLDCKYFDDFRRVLTSAFREDINFGFIQASSESGWFDVGQLLDPVAPHRGFPHVKRSEAVFSSRVAARVGVAAGICLGDPDVSAATRITQGPIVHRFSELLRAGIVVDPSGKRREEITDADTVGLKMWRTTNRGTWTVFNSQNTAIIRELAPAFFMVPQWGRFDDIFASLVVQRLMREKGYVTHFGQPFVIQQRNEHDLLKDLEAEMWGSQHILNFATWLDGFVFTGKEKTTDCMRVMFTNLPTWMPERDKLQALVLAWCSDCDAVL